MSRRSIDAGNTWPNRMTTTDPVTRFRFPSTKGHTMRVLLINNDGGGFADYIDVAEGITVQQLFAQRLPGAEAANYLIRLNRQPVAQDQILGAGDRVSFTPVKIEGAV